MPTIVQMLITEEDVIFAVDVDKSTDTELNMYLVMKSLIAIVESDPDFLTEEQVVKIGKQASIEAEKLTEAVLDAAGQLWGEVYNNKGAIPGEVVH